MPSRSGPSGAVVISGAVVVVIVASVIGEWWGAEAFIAACLVGSIFAGLVITKGE